MSLTMSTVDVEWRVLVARARTQACISDTSHAFFGIQTYIPISYKVVKRNQNQRCALKSGEFYKQLIHPADIRFKAGWFGQGLSYSAFHRAYRCDHSRSQRIQLSVSFRFTWLH